MKERLEVKLSKKDYDSIEKIRIERGFEDRQDYIVSLIQREIKSENRFISKLKKLF